MHAIAIKMQLDQMSDREISVQIQTMRMKIGYYEEADRLQQAKFSYDNSVRGNVCVRTWGIINDTVHTIFHHPVIEEPMKTCLRSVFKRAVVYAGRGIQDTDAAPLSDDTPGHPETHAQMN